MREKNARVGGYRNSFRVHGSNPGRGCAKHGIRAGAPTGPTNVRGVNDHDTGNTGAAAIPIERWLRGFAERNAFIGGTVTTRIELL